MTHNEFYNSIKAILTKAETEGWTVPQIEDNANEAILEWFEETSSEEK